MSGSTTAVRDLEVWAADGLSAILSFVIGVELTHELVAGSRRHPREAPVPVDAAVAPC